MSPFLLTWSQGFHVIPIIPLGMHSGYHCPSQMKDVLKLLLSGAIPCTKLIQMFWDVEWGLKCPGFDILALLHTCCMSVGKYWVSSLPHFLGCEINNSTLMRTHPQKCKSWHIIKAQQLLTITCPCQHHHCYCCLTEDSRWDASGKNGYRRELAFLTSMI